MSSSKGVNISKQDRLCVRKCLHEAGDILAYFILPPLLSKDKDKFKEFLNSPEFENAVLFTLSFAYFCTELCLILNRISGESHG